MFMTFVRGIPTHNEERSLKVLKIAKSTRSVFSKNPNFSTLRSNFELVLKAYENTFLVLIATSFQRSFFFKYLSKSLFRLPLMWQNLNLKKTCIFTFILYFTIYQHWHIMDHSCIAADDGRETANYPSASNVHP